jgi:hypothetical protein
LGQSHSDIYPHLSRAKAKNVTSRLAFFILTLIGDGGPLSGPNYGFHGLGRIWQNKGLSPLAIVSGLFNFPPPLSLKSKNISIFIRQEPRQRMLPHAWLFYFDPYWGWRTPFWTKLWVPGSGKDLVNKGLSPMAIFSGLFSFQPPLSRKCLSF